MQALRNVFKNRILTLTVFIIVSACCCCFVILAGAALVDPENLSTPQARAAVTNTASAQTNTPVPPTPTATSRPTEAPPTPVPTARNTEPPATGLIPGLTPADVTLNMEERNFDCTNAERGQLYYTWVCTRENTAYTLRVDVYARVLATVDYVSATAIQYGTPDDDFAASFLGFVATLPYDGAEPENARAWVESTLPTLTGEGDVRTRTFGDVLYQLYGIPTARFLEMGDLK